MFAEILEQNYKNVDEVFLIDPCTNETCTKEQFYDKIQEEVKNIKYIPKSVIHLPIDNTVESMVSILANALKKNTIQLVSPKETYHIENLDTNCDVIIGSSGSTMSIKRIKLLWKKALLNSQSMTTVMETGKGNVHMLLMPLCHVNSLFYSFLSCFMSRQIIVMPKRLDIFNFWNWVEKFDVASVNVSPTIIRMINSRPAPSKTKLKKVLCASSPLRKKDYNLFKQKTGISIIQGYGLSEATNFSTVMPVDNLLREEANKFFEAEPVLSIGNALPEHDIQLDNGNQLCIDSPSNFEGYIGQQPCQTLGTGDIGYFREFKGKRYWFLKGRQKEIIKYRDETLYPQDIEQKIQKHFKNSEYFCFGFKNQYDGECIGMVLDKQNISTDLMTEVYNLRHLNYRYYPRLVLIRNIELYSTETKKPKRLYSAEQIEKQYQNYCFGSKILIDTKNDIS